MIRDVSYHVNVLRNGAEFARLHWRSGDNPNIMVNQAAEIKGSFSGRFYVPDTVDLLSDELQPVMRLNGVETPLGVFQTATPSRATDRYNTVVQIEAYDRCWRLQNQRTENILHIAAGTSYITKIRQMLTEAGIGLVIAAPSTATLQTDREDWEIGTTYLAIINQLLAEINYSDVWFDGSGIAHLEPYEQPSADRIDHAYSYNDVVHAQPIGPDHNDETDIFNAPNVFVRICSNPDLDADMVATAVNESPTSSTSTFKRKMRIVDVQRVDNIASQDELQAAADRARNESMLAARTITFQTLNEPGHGVGDIISIDDPELAGIYEETGWSLTMATGQMMQHTAKRTVIA